MKILLLAAMLIVGCEAKSEGNGPYLENHIRKKINDRHNKKTFIYNIYSHTGKISGTSYCVRKTSHYMGAYLGTRCFDTLVKAQKYVEKQTEKKIIEHYGRYTD